MHHCLCVSEILRLIVEHIQDNGFDKKSFIGRRTLASLARTSRLFNSPALDVLWKDLYSFDPLLNVFPMSSSSLVNDARWLTFRKYAERVKTIHQHDMRVPTTVRKDFVASLQHCPKVYLPLLPNVTELEWRDFSISPCRDSGVWLLKHFGGIAVTTVALSFLHRLSPFELAVIAELPKLCPNVASFTMVLGYSWADEVSEEMGRMVAKWQKLQTLRTSAVSQPVMDQLLAHETLEALCIDYHIPSPVCTGRIPDTIRDFSLGADSPSSCTYFLSTVHASPTNFCLIIDLDEPPGEADIEDMFLLLPRRLDTSLLRSLAIEPITKVVGYTLRLHEWHIPPLAQFTALRELDLGRMCTSHMTDADHGRLVGSLIHLRTLKLGTAIPEHARLLPIASVGAVVKVLTCCPHLETLHILFNGSILPPGGFTSKMIDPGELMGRGLSERMTKLSVGHSPIKDATIHIIASCIRSIMPCLVQIEHEHEEWRAVQKLLDHKHTGCC